MKKILAIALLLPVVAYAQLPSKEQYEAEQAQFWNNALGILNSNPTSRISGTTILYDKVTPFASLFTYNEADNNVSDAVHFRQALSEMYRASDKTLFQSPEMLDNGIQSFAGTVVVPVGILDVDFSYLNYTPENPHLNALRLENKVFHPIDNRPVSTQKHITVLSPLSKVAMGNAVVYRFDNSWWYQHGNKSIQSLSADFGNGALVSVIQNGQLVQNKFPITYSQADEVKKITFHITYTDGSTLTTYAGISIMASRNSTMAKNGSPLLAYTSTIPSENNALGQIEYRIFYGDNNTEKKLKKPFIIVDGFDPGDKRKIIKQDCINDVKYKCVEKNRPWEDENYESIEYLMKYGDNKVKDLKAKLTAQGYDVVIVNFPNYTNNLGQEVDGGADDIFQNGRTIASFIQYLNGQLQTNGSAEKLVVVGPSMGGQITRYALAYLEKNGIPTNTRLWISMDSPHQGANIPLAIQGDLYWMGEILNKEEAKQKYRSVLNSPAAKQMLLQTFEEKPFPYPILGQYIKYLSVEDKEHQQYVTSLRDNGVSGSNGYPVLDNIKKIAITNGSIVGTKNVNPGEKFYEVAAFAKVRFLGIKVDNKPVFRINNWFSNNRDIKGNIFENFSYEPYNEYSVKYTNDKFYNSLDAVPGGSFNSANDLKDEVYDTLTGTNALSFPLGVLVMTDKKLIVEQRIPNNIQTAIAPQSFIPTHSALDTNGFSDWYQPISNSLVCSSQTPFDSYYGENHNMPHVTFTDNMVTWLMSWLNGNELPPTVPNPKPIGGDSVICENEEKTYVLDACEFPNNVQWTIEGGTIVSHTNSSVIVRSNINGLMKLTANFPGTLTPAITKKIWVGKPKLNINIHSTPTYAEAFIENIEEQGINPHNITWRNKQTNQITTGIDYIAFQFTPLEVTATNECGSSTVNIRLIKKCPEEYIINRIQGDAYQLHFTDLCQFENSRNASTLNNRNSHHTIELANAMGQTVLTTSQDTFDISHLPAGAYYARVIKNGQVVHTQVLRKQ
ncbi:esterase/lipase family protein [Bergeyella zoohelcum]|uniref:Por secretion system C-terminal sorting domain n=1 Tax=Bergeyella zoohelcum TaxID=1015 RepID=A0A376C0F0_9FLAO|nr:hypothetical protein [Bergeyella zoohelcum]EKB61199.1 hypothetical protein HMPREF9700_00694 [Bergeyella zoohelcum CCUG 30536]SSZ46710.1 Uncharacterised protein [Bergeyella zoohelcum]